MVKTHRRVNPAFLDKIDVVDSELPSDSQNFSYRLPVVKVDKFCEH